MKFILVLLISFCGLSLEKAGATEMLSLFRCARELGYITAGSTLKSGVFVEGEIIFLPSYRDVPGKVGKSERQRVLWVYSERFSGAYELVGGLIAFRVPHVDPRRADQFHSMKIYLNSLTGGGYEEFMSDALPRSALHQILRPVSASDAEAKRELTLALITKLETLLSAVLSGQLPRQDLHQGNLAFCRDVSLGFRDRAQRLSQLIDHLERISPIDSAPRLPAGFSKN